MKPISVTPASVERFWPKVFKTPECWIWLGCITSKKNPDPYGTFWDGKITVLAHRFAYTAEYGRIPARLVLDHLCETHLCIRPRHLEAVTHAENVRRGCESCSSHSRPQA